MLGVVEGRGQGVDGIQLSFFEIFGFGFTFSPLLHRVFGPLLVLHYLCDLRQQIVRCSPGRCLRAWEIK